MKKITFIFIVILAVLLSFLMADVTFASMLASGSGETKDYSSFSSSSYEEETQDLPPEAVLRVRNNTGNFDQLSGTTSTKFTFDGNGSNDEETSTHLLEVRFDFENDGQVDTYFSVTRTADHVYETPGLKTVRMEVLDRGGNVSSTTQKIYVVENTPPEAYFSINPKVGTPATEFVLDSSSSSDSQYRRTLLEYRYDFNGDGEWDTKFKSATRIKHNFDYPGIKNITMEVRDPEGSSSFYKQTVYIRENKPPVANFEAKATNDNGRINFDAGNSYDPDGTALQYKWDFNYTGENDIMWDTSWTSSNNTFATFKKSGEYLVKLIVKDKDESVSIKLVKVFIDLLSS